MATSPVTATAPFSMTIGGNAVATTSTFPVTNPATRRVAGDAPGCTVEQLNAAVTAARRAQPAWAALPVDERRNYLRAIADVIDTH